MVINSWQLNLGWEQFENQHINIQRLLKKLQMLQFNYSMYMVIDVKMQDKIFITTNKIIFFIMQLQLLFAMIKIRILNNLILSIKMIFCQLLIIKKRI
jgi:hypothetical protein